MKSTSVPNTIASNRLLSERIPYPLHLGITEAGTKWSGSLKSAVGLGTLLADGIGDTIRISLSTFHAEEEVKVAWEILKALKLRERGPVLIACPTCGRLQFDMDTVVTEVERRLEAYDDPIEVSVLGCAVNGIGEARHADFGITGAKDMGMIYSRGETMQGPDRGSRRRAVRRDRQVLAAGKHGVRDAGDAVQTGQWLAENEDARDDSRAHGRDGGRSGRASRGVVPGGWPALSPSARQLRTGATPTGAWRQGRVSAGAHRRPNGGRLGREGTSEPRDRTAARAVITCTTWPI